MEENYSEEQVTKMLKSYGDLRYSQGVLETELSPSGNAEVIKEKSKLVEGALDDVNTLVPPAIRKSLDGLPEKIFHQEAP